MPKFIRVIEHNSGNDVYVNPDHITHITIDEEFGLSVLHLTGGQSLTVMPDFSEQQVKDSEGDLDSTGWEKALGIFQ